jgi:hypothetical protein
MNVFISWSGSSSKAVAEVLRDWLPDMISACDPRISSRDIDAGARWYPDLVKQLEQAQVGVVCITSDNLGDPWIYFETGAVAKKPRW